MAANTKRNQQIAANRSNGQHATANFKDGSRYQHFDSRFKRALSVPPRGQVQSLRAFRRPKLGGLELPGFQDWTRLTCRGAAEDIISESWGFLNATLIRRAWRSTLGLPGSSRRSPGALFSSSWASLGGLSRNLGGPWETLRQPLAVFWWLLAALGEKTVPIWT